VIEERVPVGVPADLSVLCAALARDGELAGYPVSERFYEIGTPDGLAELEQLLARRSSGSDDGKDCR
jgi:NDP-sugar pyrophosphorylase family protein